MAKPGVHVLVEHREPLDRERVLRLFRACGPARHGPGAPIGEADRERWAADAEKAGWSSAYAWSLPGSEREVRVALALRATAFPMRGLDPASWLHLKVELPFASDDDARWLAAYLDAMRAALDVPFAFADTEHHLRLNANADPRRLAWPVMLVPGAESARVRDAGAIVDELAGGALLVRVAEAPFAARARVLEALGERLGRRARA